MTKEKISQKIRNLIATSIYLNPTGIPDGFHGYDTATEKIMNFLYPKVEGTTYEIVNSKTDYTIRGEDVSEMMGLLAMLNKRQDKDIYRLEAWLTEDGIKVSQIEGFNERLKVLHTMFVPNKGEK